MKPLFAVVLAFSLLSPVIAQNRTFLPKAEVEALAGKKWGLVLSANQHKLQWNLRPDGTFEGSNFTVSRHDSGNWRLNDQGQVCVKWHGRGGSRFTDRCVAVLKEDSKLALVDSNDLNGRYADLTVE